MVGVLAVVEVGAVVEGADTCQVFSRNLAFCMFNTAPGKYRLERIAHVVCV